MAENSLSSTEKTTHHPLEDMLGIEPGTTVMTDHEEPNLPAIVDKTYDEKDIEIEKQFQEVYDTGMTTFRSLTEDLEVTDPRFRARTAEVASQYLNTSLAAAKEKLNQKQNKDKIAANISSDGPKTINNNLIVADRNKILRALFDQE